MPISCSHASGELYRKNNHRKSTAGSVGTGFDYGMFPSSFPKFKPKQKRVEK